MPDAIITAPGVYDIPEAVYHADPCPAPSLSASGIKDLMPVLGGCPAKWKFRREHPEPPKDAFDLGSVAHALVLGKGASFQVFEVDDWRGKADREARDAARAAGLIPIKRADFDRARIMADVLRRHPYVGAAFQEGRPEMTLAWRDAETGVWCRARPDYLPNSGNIFADYKTAASVHPDDLARAVDNFAYFVRAAFYIEGIRSLGLCDNPVYLFVAQEKEPPYLVTPFVLSQGALEWGAVVVRRAVHDFADCLERDRWPGFADRVLTLDLPGYAGKRLADAAEAGALDIKSADMAAT